MQTPEDGPPVVGMQVELEGSSVGCADFRMRRAEWQSRTRTRRTPLARRAARQRPRHASLFRAGQILAKREIGPKRQMFCVAAEARGKRGARTVFAPKRLIFPRKTPAAFIFDTEKNCARLSDQLDESRKPAPNGFGTRRIWRAITSG